MAKPIGRLSIRWSNFARTLTRCNLCRSFARGKWTLTTAQHALRTMQFGVWLIEKSCVKRHQSADCCPKVPRSAKTT